MAPMSASLFPHGQSSSAPLPSTMEQAPTAGDPGVRGVLDAACRRVKNARRLVPITAPNPK
jgi:hypothetical protein